MTMLIKIFINYLLLKIMLNLNQTKYTRGKYKPRKKDDNKELQIYEETFVKFKNIIEKHMKRSQLKSKVCTKLAEQINEFKNLRSNKGSIEEDLITLELGLEIDLKCYEEPEIILENEVTLLDNIKNNLF